MLFIIMIIDLVANCFVVHIQDIGYDRSLTVSNHIKITRYSRNSLTCTKFVW